MKASDNEFPSVLFEDQASAPTTPASGFSRVFTKSDGLYLVDDAGTVTGPFAEATSAAVGAKDIERYTGGDIALASTTMAAVTGPGDLVVAAAAGDLLLLGLSVRAVANTGQSISFDMATIVSAAVVNYVGALSSTPLTTGVPTWYIGSAELSGAGGAYPYVVQAGDISGGNVTLRLYARVSGNRTIEADSNVPLVMWVKNLLQ